MLELCAMKQIYQKCSQSCTGYRCRLLRLMRLLISASYCRFAGEVAQHRHMERQRDFVNQPRDEFGRPVAGRHSDKPWHEYRPGIVAAAEPSARLPHPPPPGTSYCPSVLDTVGWVIWPVKIVPDMTYNVFGGTLNPTLLYSTNRYCR